MEDQFQERVERLQRGEPLEACQAGLPQEEAELLALAAELEQVEYPQRDAEVVAAQRARLLELAAKERNAETRSPEPRFLKRFWPNWLTPAAAISVSVAVLFVCVILALVGGGLTWRTLRDSDATPAPLPVAVSEDDRRISPEPSPTLSEGMAQHVSPQPSPTMPPQVVARSQVSHTLLLPSVFGSLSSRHAMLEKVRGVVQVQGEDGTWSAANAGQIIEVGDRVRTGALSSVHISFYDHSAAYLGPDTEVSIDDLGLDPKDESRIVELTQRAGETDHQVTPAYGTNARYEVHTPSGTAEAKGTAFHVSVTPAMAVRLSVDEGAVAVTHLDVTVVVAAGQVTTIDVGKPPAKPVFRVTGEGKVEEMGRTWRIAGQDFETHAATIIVGDPHIGDWVYVDGRLLEDGTLVADRIVLLRRALVSRFTIVGEVQATGAFTWTVAGQEIAVDDATEIDEGIQVGDQVRVEGGIDEEGALLARSIHLIREEGLLFSFVGVVEEISDAYWVVSGISVTVDAETVIADGLAVGNIVLVRGRAMADGTWLARSISRLVPEERRFEFVGLVESIDPWVVSGIALETRMWTEIEDGIEVDDRVKVAGRILPDGTWLAEEIKLADADKDLSFEFVGRLERIEPWVVSGIPLTVNRRTDIEDGIEVGDRVKVKGRILPDGTWLATEIKLVHPQQGIGCIQFTALVVRMSAERLVLHNGITIPLDEGTHIEGEIRVHSVIWVEMCTDAYGRVAVTRIIVLYQIEPSPTPTPTATPVLPAPPEPPGDGEVTICHKPGTPAEKTMRIPWSALPGHLGHGDYIGPCQ